MFCPKCGTECCRDEVDVGVGVVTGPYGCPVCGWSEDPLYDLSEGQNPLDENGGAMDQYGSYHPPGSSMAAAIRMACDPLEKVKEHNGP